MRDIKFRGRRVDNNEWVYGVPIFSKEEEQIAYLMQDSGEWVVQAKTVGQFTGLLDKNGKEIYEGDIIQQYPTPNSTYVTAFEDLHPLRKIVAWYDDEGRFELRNMKNEGHQSGYTFCRDNAKDIFEVIGNIYENPEVGQ